MLILSFCLPYFERYRQSVFYGLAIFGLISSAGALLIFYKDIRSDPEWFGKIYKDKNYVSVILSENPIEKTNSFKAVARVIAVKGNDETFLATGKIIIYFKKDSSTLHLEAGKEIIFSRRVQVIKNTGNPGSFDYKQYCLFQGITHQVYLQPGDFAETGFKTENFATRILSPLRKKILRVFKEYIPGDKERGVAEALLIGYKDDLDKTLVQSYSNTGVVHIIAISGLHLGLIYWMLVQILRPVKKIARIKWLVPVCIISCLWLFSLLAGAQPSVLRSAVMFTAIILAESVKRKTSIYNGLAFSAFVLLCIDPFWLWDVGFQLSYAAVLSIVLFFKPVYNVVYVKNKLLDLVWKLNAVTLAAQILTTPLSIFHFHQFPNFFLLTNFVAVPLSTIILFAEILLCTLPGLSFFSTLLGKLISCLIRFMNNYIQHIESFPYSVWEGLQVSGLQVFFLLTLIGGTSYFLFEKNKTGAWLGLASLLVFITLRSISFNHSLHQKKLIVYNIPKQTAMEMIAGRKAFLFCDSAVINHGVSFNFHIRPSIIKQRIELCHQTDNNFTGCRLFNFEDKKIMIVNGAAAFDSLAEKIPIDVLIISKNPRVNFYTLTSTFKIEKIVFDASVQPRKIEYWKKQCDSLRLKYYDVAGKGAFVMNLN